MSIQLKCPNGHTLSAQESNAGKTGKCPVCKAPVEIPAKRSSISDSSIVRILGDPVFAPKNSSNTPAAPVKKNSSLRTAGAAVNADEGTLPHIKPCPHCEREIDMGYHICPHCHTYITNPNDF